MRNRFRIKNIFTLDHFGLYLFKVLEVIYGQHLSRLWLSFLPDLFRIAAFCDRLCRTPYYGLGLCPPAAPGPHPSARASSAAHKVRLLTPWEAAEKSPTSQMLMKTGLLCAHRVLSDITITSYCVCRVCVLFTYWFLDILDTYCKGTTLILLNGTWYLLKLYILQYCTHSIYCMISESVLRTYIYCTTICTYAWLCSTYVYCTHSDCVWHILYVHSNSATYMYVLHAQ